VRFGQSQTEQETARGTTHRRNIAQRPSEALPAHRIGRMLLPQEVSAFEEPVTGENCFVPALRLEERGIIANSESDGFSGVPRRGPEAIRDLS
jgi:hypothetical protein